MTRLGIFGGSFDPPHTAHFEMAIKATESVPLDGLYLVPAYQAPLKKGKPVAPASHRIAMVSLLAEERSGWQVLTYEVDQRRPVPAIETVEHLRQREPAADWYLVIGSDQAAQLDKWHQWERLVQRVRILCFARAGFSPAAQVADRMELIPFDISISSSDIRERIRCGGPTDEMLPPTIHAYIREHRLYA